MTFCRRRLSASRTGHLYPKECSWYSFSLEAESTPGPWSLKNPVTPPGIDPGNVRLVTQLLNHYATPGPHQWHRQSINFPHLNCCEKCGIIFGGFLVWNSARFLVIFNKVPMLFIVICKHELRECRLRERLVLSNPYKFIHRENYNSLFFFSSEWLYVLSITFLLTYQSVLTHFSMWRYSFSV
jgi:hypothetical protein